MPQKLKQIVRDRISLNEKKRTSNNKTILFMRVCTRVKKETSAHWTWTHYFLSSPILSMRLILWHAKRTKNEINEKRKLRLADTTHKTDTDTRIKLYFLWIMCARAEIEIKLGTRYESLTLHIIWLPTVYYYFPTPNMRSTKFNAANITARRTEISEAYLDWCISIWIHKYEWKKVFSSWN